MLAEAGRLGVVMTRMKLAKLLYLADVEAAQEFGKPLSGIEWRWLHYGPFNNELLTIENSLVGEGLIQRDVTNNFFGSPEYRLRISDEIDFDAAVGPEFLAHIRSVLSKWGSESPTALKDRTYATAPMVEAQVEGANGELLDLDVPRPIPDISVVLREYAAFRDALPEEDEPVEFGATTEIVEILAVNRHIANQHLLG